MKRNLNLFLTVFVLASMVLAACTPKATPTAEVPPTDKPAPTAVPPTEIPQPTFNGTVTVTFVQEPDNLNPMYTDMYFSLILREFYLKPAWTFDENVFNLAKKSLVQFKRHFLLHL